MLFEDVQESCPYCFETVSIPVDPGGGEEQEFYVDCEVCCRPILVKATKSEFHDGYSIVLDRS